MRLSAWYQCAACSNISPTICCKNQPQRHRGRHCRKAHDSGLLLLLILVVPSAFAFLMAFAMAAAMASATTVVVIVIIIVIEITTVFIAALVLFLQLFSTLPIFLL